jgi:heat shock protein HtpX
VEKVCRFLRLTGALPASPFCVCGIVISDKYREVKIMYIADFAKSLFRKGNIGIIAYLVINITLYITLLGGFTNGGMAAIGLGLYLVSLCVALSPLGEWILRMQTGCKPLKDQEQINRLMPLFNQVYSKAKAKDPSISDKVKLYISQDEEPNAFATGRKTICLTRGMLRYTDGQIMGTLAHEFAHLAHKDTDLLLLITVGNFLMSAIFVVYRVVITLFVGLFTGALRMGSLGTFLTSFLINTILAFLMWCWTKLGVLLVLHSGRQAEYAADQFAFELGYGEELGEVLESFDTGGGGKGLWANLHASHPEARDRITRIEQLNATGGALQPAPTGPYALDKAQQPAAAFAPQGNPNPYAPAPQGGPVPYAPAPQGYQPASQPMGMAAFAPAGAAMHAPPAQQQQYVPPQPEYSPQPQQPYAPQPGYPPQPQQQFAPPQPDYAPPQQQQQFAPSEPGPQYAPPPEPEPPQAASSSDACPSCSSVLSPGAKFCVGCGSQVTAPQGGGRRFCTGCGTGLTENAKFCTGCGTQT